MTRNKKFSAILAVLVIGLFSIYATNLTFNSGNQGSTQLNITLNMLSGAQIPVSIAPGQTVPTQLNGDQVVGITYAGQYDPAGANATMSCPTGGYVQMIWQMGGGNTPCGVLGSWVDTETQS